MARSQWMVWTGKENIIKACNLMEEERKRKGVEWNPDLFRSIGVLSNGILERIE